MTWHVQYNEGAAAHVARYHTPELAIEAACHLLDAGVDVFGIGTGPLSDSIELAQIAKIYDLWARARRL